MENRKPKSYLEKLEKKEKIYRDFTVNCAYTLRNKLVNVSEMAYKTLHKVSLVEGGIEIENESSDKFRDKVISTYTDIKHDWEEELYQLEIGKQKLINGE